MPGRPSVKSAFDNLRPTILREPNRSAVSPEAEARLLQRREHPSDAAAEPSIVPDIQAQQDGQGPANPAQAAAPFPAGSLLQSKKRERLLLVSFRMPQSLKEKLEAAAKRHDLNQTDLINEGIELNLQRYL